MLTGLQKNLRFFMIHESRTQIRHIQGELSSPSPTYQHHMLKMNLMAEKNLFLVITLKNIHQSNYSDMKFIVIPIQLQTVIVFSCYHKKYCMHNIKGNNYINNAHFRRQI